jgi:hypothetical protein
MVELCNSHTTKTLQEPVLILNAELQPIRASAKVHGGCDLEAKSVAHKAGVVCHRLDVKMCVIVGKAHAFDLLSLLHLGSDLIRRVLDELYKGTVHAAATNCNRIDFHQPGNFVVRSEDIGTLAFHGFQKRR